MAPRAAPHGSRRAVAGRNNAAALALILVGLLAVIVIRVAAATQTTPTTAAPVREAIVRASDISNMSPGERASRLYDRVMRLHEEQKMDSVAFFAPMALESYAAIPNLDLDGRYDMARIAMIAGAFPLARAEDDTILQRDSTHLLGLLLAADLDRTENREASAKRMESAFVNSATRERKRMLPQYAAHSLEIETALRRLSSH